MDVVDLLARGEALTSRGEYDMAEAALTDALEAAARGGDAVLLTRARLALGELLLGLERTEEAQSLLYQVMRTDLEDVAVHAEVKRAAVLLSHLRGWYVD